MQTPIPEISTSATFFSRERRRQRTRSFFEAFERRTLDNIPRLPLFRPFAKPEVDESACAGAYRVK